METATKMVTALRERPKLLFVLVAAGILVLHLFIFRDVLLASGDTLQNKASVVRDELVPFFSFANGYMPSATSELTGSDEFRVTYSFWTSWVRFNPILPIMLVLVNALAAYLLFYAFYRVVRHFAASPHKAVFVSLLAAMLIHCILLYAKIAHFYTLILGFGMFALALSLVIEQFFFAAKLSIKHMVFVIVLVLLNPAIHYHIIFYLGAGLIFGLHTIMALVLRTFTWRQLGRNALYVGIVVVASLVPYLAYIYLTTPASEAVFQQIPVNYWMIFYSSVPLLYLLSFDSLGHVDLFRYGDYRAPQATASMLIIFALIAGLFLLRGWRHLTAAKKSLLYILFVVTLLSIWMAIGYSSKSLISFHDTLGAISSFLAHVDNIVAHAAEQVVNVFINILRFPHRFQFLFYYAAGVLLALVLLWLYNLARERGISMVLSCLGIVALIVVPLLASPAYRDTFLTGNFGGFLAPYKIPDDLVHIKSELDQQKDNRVFILPSLESGRVITTQGQRHSFLDKYLIYYLEQPAVYTGYGADTTQKIVSHMVYRSIVDGTNVWQDMLIDNLGVTHILVPKHTEQRSEQTVYLPGIEEKISQSLAKSTRFTKAHDGPDFALYQVAQRPQPQANLLANVSWQTFGTTFGQPDSSWTQRLFFPVQQGAYQKAAGDHFALTDNPERNFYRLYTAKKGGIAVPDTTLLPFTTKLIPSSTFTANMFSLSTLYNRDDDYNYTKEAIPSLLNLQTAQFVGVAASSDSQVSMKLSTAQAGQHRLLLHAASQHDTITAQVDGQQVKLRRIKGDAPTKDFVDFTYYTADVTLPQGTHTVTIASGNKTTLVEYAAALPTSDIPDDFTHVTLPGLTISPTPQPTIYKVTF